MDKLKKINNKKLEELKENVTIEELKEMLFDCISYDGSFEDLDFRENDEYFFEDYFRTKDEVARAICYGEYNYMDDYVRFNAYGNLESANQYEVEEEIENYKEEIIEHYLELYADNNVYPSDKLKVKLYDFYEEDEEEKEV